MEKRRWLLALAVTFFASLLALSMTVIFTAKCQYIGIKSYNNNTIVVYFDKMDKIGGHLEIKNASVEEVLDIVIKEFNGKNVEIEDNINGFDYIVKVCERLTG